MDLLEFKVRLVYHPEDSEDIYLDTVDPGRMGENLFEWNWLDVAGDYSPGPSREYLENYHRLHHGFDDSDVYSEITYEGGFCCVRVLSAIPLGTRRTVHDTTKRALVTRPLLDWVKISINGSLSDGVGENPVSSYDGNEVWLSDLVTTEPTTEDKSYFLIPDPIRVDISPGILSGLVLPGSMERLRVASDWSEKEKIIYEATEWSLKKIKEYEEKSKL